MFANPAPCARARASFENLGVHIYADNFPVIANEFSRSHRNISGAAPNIKDFHPAEETRFPEKTLSSRPRTVLTAVLADLSPLWCVPSYMSHRFFSHSRRLFLLLNE